MLFRLGGSAIFGLGRAEIRPRWRYVGTKLAYVGPGLDLFWLMVAHVGHKVGCASPGWGHVGPMLGRKKSHPGSPSIPPPPPLPATYIYTLVGLAEEKKTLEGNDACNRMTWGESLLDGVSRCSLSVIYIYVYIYIYQAFPPLMGWLGCAERIQVQDVLGGRTKMRRKRQG